MPCDFRLEVFITLCRTGSFTRAADALGISQPAVSQNIAELEKDLGVRLFSRSRGEVSLTSDGTLFRNYAERILYWYDSAREAFRAGKSSPGPITLHCPSDLSPVVVPELFTALRHSFPDLAFVSRPFAPGIQSVEDEQGNCLYLYSSVCGLSQPFTPCHAGEELLCSCMPVVAVSPVSRYLREDASDACRISGSCPRLAVLSYESSGNSPVGMADDAAVSQPERSVEDLLAAAGLSGKVVFISDSAEAVKHVARTDPEIAAVLPPYCINDDFSEARLAQLPSSWLGFRYCVSVRVPDTLRQLPVSEDIVRILREMLSSDPQQSR